jgi:hypothetical protein
MTTWMSLHSSRIRRQASTPDPSGRFTSSTTALFGFEERTQTPTHQGMVVGQ